MDDEKLILFVQNNKELYDKSNPCYKLAGRKQMLWEQIARELNSTAEMCMRRWAALRDRYGREVRKESAPSGSGSQYHRPWYLLEALRFLKPHVVPCPFRCSRNICPASSPSTGITGSPPQLLPSPPVRVQLPSPSPPTTVSLPSPSPPIQVQLPSPSRPTTVSLPSPSPPTQVQLSSQSPSTTVSLPSPSPPIQVHLPSPSPPTTVSLPSPSPQIQVQLPSPPSSSPVLLQSNRSRGTRRRGSNIDVDKSMYEAIELFKTRCAAREEHSNPALNSFGMMMISIISKMTAAKQSRAMQRMMEVAFEVQQEPD
ncbi:pectinesterase inhibitor 10-like [Rhagoletis pomonella]|uniref:pectinesterase inhibitor 10-like n=1 Tax=Rhagoletis pomonella TaxID=28610 RepID=UPI0017851E41|nr:pectinesterase inhibitor 10-like [Rhagoletis pomonella]